MSKATEYAAWIEQAADDICEPLSWDDFDQQMRGIAAELRRLEPFEANFKRQVVLGARLLDATYRARSAFASMSRRGNSLCDIDYNEIDSAIMRYEGLSATETDALITCDALEVARMIGVDFGKAKLSESLADRVAARVERYADSRLAAVEQERDELLAKAVDFQESQSKAINLLMDINNAIVDESEGEEGDFLDWITDFLPRINEVLEGQEK
ncbi:hypothetical protein ACTSKR_11505 [Chitinibacteraceae bacterium HSL-7]